MIVTEIMDIYFFCARIYPQPNCPELQNMKYIFHPRLKLCFSQQPDRVKKCKETPGSEHSEGRTLLLRRLDRLPWWQSILVHHLAYSVSDIIVLTNSVYNSVTWLIKQCFLAPVSVSTQRRSHDQNKWVGYPHSAKDLQIVLLGTNCRLLDTTMRGGGAW